MITESERIARFIHPYKPGRDKLTNKANGAQDQRVNITFIRDKSDLTKH